MTGIEFQPEAMLAHSAWLRKLARELCRDAHAAEDLAQDTLVAAMTRGGPDRASPRTWLAAIARKLAASRIRAESRRERRERRAALDEAVPAAGDTVERFALHQAVVDAVMQLDEPYRTTVLLRFWEELSARAIAARQAIPLETVRTRLKRGIAMLRARLDATRGGRRAWALPLASSLRLWRDSGTGASTTLAVGGALMTAKTKLGLAAAVLLAGLWLGFDSLTGTLPVAPPGPENGIVTAATAGPVEEPDDAETRTEPERTPVARSVPVEPDRATPRLTVTGRLVAEETGASIADAQVRLVDTTDEDARDPAVEPHVRTAPDGTFVLTDDRAGSELADKLFVLVPGRASLRVHVDTEAALRGETADVALGDVPVPHGTAVSGRVEDPTGHGVAGAGLLVPTTALSLGFDGTDNILDHARSLGHADARGAFTLEERLAPAIEHRFLIAVSALGLGWADLELTRQRRELEDTVVRLRPTGTLEVAVTDESGTPADGIAVRVEPRFAPIGAARDDIRMLLGSDPRVLALFEARTDRAGRATFGHLPIGGDRPGAAGNRYGVLVTAPGYGHQRPAAVSIEAGARKSIAVRLQTARVLRVTGTVRTTDGAPVAGATASVSGTEDAESRTDAAGRFEIEGVAVGPTGSRARIEADGYIPHREQVEPDAGRDHVSLDVVLRRALELTGRVVDSDGDPVPGRMVSMRRLPVAETLADGTFRIAPFPDGEHAVRIAHPARDASRYGGQTPKVFRASDSPVTIVLQRFPVADSVIFELVDKTTGEPLEARDVQMHRYDENGKLDGWSMTDKAIGRVTAKDVRYGTWKLKLTTPTGHRGEHAFTVPHGAREHRERVALLRPGTITGRIDAGGLPAGTEIGELRVTVTCDSNRSQSFVRYAHLGRWRLGEGQRRHSDEPSPEATGTLVLDPTRDPTFRLESADTNEPLTIHVRGHGVNGSTRVTVPPGGAQQVVVQLSSRS